jgi:hypothetical protein
MYAQDYSFYKRPDTTGVTWLTPQQLEAARVACVLAPVKVLEKKPLVRAETADTDDNQSLIAAAPALFADAIRKGLAVVHKEMPRSALPIKGVRTFTLKHRRKIAAAIKHQHSTH